jgi:hypothetical protein
VKAVPRKGPASQKPTELKSTFRLWPGQVEDLAEQSDKLKRLHKKAFKKMTARAQEAIEAKVKGKKWRSMTAMVEKTSASLSVSTPLAAGSSVTGAVRNGTAGQSPKKRGPYTLIPSEVLNVATSLGRVGQVSGDEKTNIQLGQNMLAAVAGTAAEGKFAARAAKTALKKSAALYLVVERPERAPLAVGNLP